MPFWNHLPYLARRLDRRRAEKDLDDELQAHLDLEIEGNLAAGMSRGGAPCRTRKLATSPRQQDVLSVWGCRWWRRLEGLRHALACCGRGPARVAPSSAALGSAGCTRVAW